MVATENAAALTTDTPLQDYVQGRTVVDTGIAARCSVAHTMSSVQRTSRLPVKALLSSPAYTEKCDQGMIILLRPGVSKTSQLREILAMTYQLMLPSSTVGTVQFSCVAELSTCNRPDFKSQCQY